MLLAECEEGVISASDPFNFCPHWKHPQKFAQLPSKSVTSLSPPALECKRSSGRSDLRKSRGGRRCAIFIGHRKTPLWSEN